MRTPPLLQRLKRILPFATVAALLASCSTPVSPPIPNSTEVPVIEPPPVQPTQPTPPATVDHRLSQAQTARDYRKDAATHLYALNQARIYPGKLPPMLHAVGVLQVEIDRRGYITGISWMRAPRHAPDVMAEIERSVRQAAPFPAPVRMGKVTYTDTWLWHASGRFQLDTLTEGQL